MGRIFEKNLTRIDKENGLEIRSGANLLPPGDAVLDVKDASTGNVMHFDYKVSGRQTPIIRRNIWREFIRQKDDGAIITIYKDEEFDASYKIEVKWRLKNSSGNSGTL